MIANIGTFVADPAAYKLDTPAGCTASVRIRLARRGTEKVGDTMKDVWTTVSTYSGSSGKPVFTVPVDAVFETPSAGGGAELAIVVDIIVEAN